MIIISVVYFQYFSTKKNIVEEINTSKIDDLQKLKELEKKISELQSENEELNNKLDQNKENPKVLISENLKEDIKLEINKKNEKSDMKKEDIGNGKVLDEEKKILPDKNKIENLVKDVEYTSIDQRGNTFHLLANSAKSNPKNKDVLDLINVRGKIKSDTRDTIFIVSDFAQYNTINLNSKFYDDVIINYQDKKITSLNFDINMETNKAIAYNNVIITDPKSIMKAGIVEFDLKTKDIEINPDNSKSEINIITDNGIN